MMDFWDEIISHEHEEVKEKEITICPLVGEICPKCRSAFLEYNSKLDLVCPVCGYELAAVFT